MGLFVVSRIFPNNPSNGDFSTIDPRSSTRVNAVSQGDVVEDQWFLHGDLQMVEVVT